MSHGRRLPPTVVILCFCRCRLLPLHPGGNLAAQRPGPQQLHLALGGPGGTKGKKNNEKKMKGPAMELTLGLYSAANCRHDSRPMKRHIFNYIS